MESCHMWGIYEVWVQGRAFLDLLYFSFPVFNCPYIVQRLKDFNCIMMDLLIFHLSSLLTDMFSWYGMQFYTLFPQSGWRLWMG